MSIVAASRLPASTEYEKVPRYNAGKIEAIDVIEDWGLDFNLGSVIKYICRRKNKGSEKENPTKALTYLQRATNVLEGRHEWGPKKE